MLGGMLAGHEECEGEVVTKYFETGEQWFNAKDETYNPVVEKREFVKFYGMGFLRLQWRDIRTITSTVVWKVRLLRSLWKGERYH